MHILSLDTGTCSAMLACAIQVADHCFGLIWSLACRQDLRDHCVMLQFADQMQCSMPANIPEDLVKTLTLRRKGLPASRQAGQSGSHTKPACAADAVQYHFAYVWIHLSSKLKAHFRDAQATT